MFLSTADPSWPRSRHLITYSLQVLHNYYQKENGEGMKNKNREVISMMKDSFSEIRDTRQQAQVRHDLYEIIAMTIAAVIGNSDGWDEIEDFCQSKGTTA